MCATAAELPPDSDSKWEIPLRVPLRCPYGQMRPDCLVVRGGLLDGDNPECCFDRALAGLTRRQLVP